MMFLGRHVGLSQSDIQKAIFTIGESSWDSFLNKVYPESVRSRWEPSQLWPALSEPQALEFAQKVLENNEIGDCYLGQGFYPSHCPSVIKRMVLQNPGWYTAYTPYQAEIAQGRLQALLMFQTMVAEITGLEIANASLLDEASASHEALVLMAHVSAKTPVFFLLDDALPEHVKNVLTSRLWGVGWRYQWVNFRQTDWMHDLKSVTGVLLSLPRSDGSWWDITPVVQECQKHDVKVAAYTDLMACILLTPPGELGVDVAVGNTQRFGLPLWGGGPHAAFLATRQAYVRQLPGRLVGVTRDKHGRLGFRLTLQTREQHIRRDKATSNICTAQVLLANIAAFYAYYHGLDGLYQISSQIHHKALFFYHQLQKLGLPVQDELFYDTVTLNVNDGHALWEFLKTKNILAFLHADGRISWSFDETKTEEQIARLLSAIGEFYRKSFNSTGFPPLNADNVEHPQFLKFKRKTPALKSEWFLHSKTETHMMRFLKELENKDLSLTHSMIPLGSCTMKLNPSVSLEPLGWEKAQSVHPFSPKSHTRGFEWMLQDLEKKLCTLTGFAKFCFQPNSGAQGELTGLLVVKDYFEARNEKRPYCIIPESAHGTNPASAVSAGFKVLTVKTQPDGHISKSHLQELIQQYGQSIACLMLTYPSTHGVFEWDVTEVTRIIHGIGGLVYWDGANFNAFAGWVKPTDLGVDLGHLNLHKTFAIPHGGGGPGVGPLGVTEKLIPHLPAINKHHFKAVVAAPYGSTALYTVSWIYLNLMGFEGIRQASAVAVLNANYVAKKLDPYFPVLFRDNAGFVAHECIVDTRIFRSIKIDVFDIAKRLMDYGFHAPTVSWPIPQTLMIEPTESESLDEIDRFCQALIQIWHEAHKVRQGHWPQDSNPLKNAPHTIKDVINWQYPYSIQEGVLPGHWQIGQKFWPAVNRLDESFGDRHLFCVCPSPAELASLDERI